MLVGVTQAVTRAVGTQRVHTFFVLPKVALLAFEHDAVVERHAANATVDVFVRCVDAVGFGSVVHGCANVVLCVINFVHVVVALVTIVAEFVVVILRAAYCERW